MTLIRIKLTEYVLFVSIFAFLSIFQTINVQAAEIGLAPKGYIDTPQAGSTIKGVSTVKGWFLDGSGVSKIEILVDGKTIGQAQYGSPRLDVGNSYPDYQNSNSGYQYSLDTTGLINGKHALTVKETGKNGKSTILASRQVNVQNLTVRGSIDAPTQGSTIKDESLIRGWFLDPSGVEKIEVLVDGKIVGNAQYGIERPDVYKAYSDYQNTSSGYQYSLNTNNLAKGQHTITVRETGKNGAKTELSRQVVVQSLSVRGSMDEPKQGSTIKDGSQIRGWFLDPSGAEKIEVLVDGKVVGNAQYGLERPDVKQAYPDYQNGNAGYQYTLDTSSLTSGQHTIIVRETGKNGAKTELSRQVVVQSLSVRGSIDEPKLGSTIKNNSLIRGWFLDPSGVENIEILVDGKVVGNAQYGLERSDVQRAYPDYQNGNSGYQYTLDISSLSNGQHTITVRETGKNGKNTELKSQINVSVQYLPAKGSIDSPGINAVLKGNSLIRGWFLDGSGVSKIDVLVDGKWAGEAKYGLTRNDVALAYPAYKTSDVGYEFSLDTAQYPDGGHTLTIKETGKNGTVNTLTQKITISNGNPYLLLDLKKPSNITAADIVNFFNAKNPTSPLKNYAQNFINAQNKYGVNAQYLVAHAIWETGWGGSDLKTYKHNLYGYGAYDVCPFTCGYYYPTVQDSIDSVAYQVRYNYLNDTGVFYHSEYGPTLTGMNVDYASDQNWKNGIASLMASMKQFDYSYYEGQKELGISASPPPSYGRDIPNGQPYPTDTVLNFPSGIIAKLTTDAVNFRSLPYISTSNLIGSLSKDKIVTLNGYNTDVKFDPSKTDYNGFRWYRATVDSQNGWLNGQNLSIINLLRVNDGVTGLRIRSNTDTSSNSNVVATVDGGTFLKAVISNNQPVMKDGWYQVYLSNSNETGWISGDYVDQITQ